MDQAKALQTFEALKRRLIAHQPPEYNCNCTYFSPDGERNDYQGEPHSASWSVMFDVDIVGADEQEIQDFQLLREFFGGELFGQDAGDHDPKKWESVTGSQPGLLGSSTKSREGCH